MKHVAQTCPLIDDAIAILKFRCNHTTNQCYKEKESPLLMLQTFRTDTIQEVIDILEELRDMNAELRYNATYWKRMYNLRQFGDEEFNPEVLPKK